MRLAEDVGGGRRDFRRVLHVMRMKGVSGAERHLLELAASLRTIGWRSDVFVMAPPDAQLGSFPEELAVHCDRVMVRMTSRQWGWGLLHRLIRLLQSGRYAVAHAHLVHADWLLAAASLAAPTPLVSSKHNHDPFRALLPFRLVESTAMRRYTEIIAISQSLEEFTLRYTGRRAVTVHYGLRAPSSPPHRTPARGQLLAVARLERQKGLDCLIQAMGPLCRDHPDVCLAIAGEGREREALSRLIDKAGLSNKIALLGQRSDIAELMDGAYALVHPARWEGFGLVLLEAMRQALPIVATRVGAIPEVVEHDATGILVAPDDPGAFAAAVSRLLEDAEFAAAAGERGFDRLQREFSPDLMAQRTAAVYEHALGVTSEIASAS